MMATRKRKHSSDEHNHNTTSKKHMSNAREKTKIEKNRSSRPSSQNSEPLYQVRDIIGEKGNKYHIQWEDDPVTGEKFAPTWVLTYNLSEFLTMFADYLHRNRRLMQTKRLLLTGNA